MKITVDIPLKENPELCNVSIICQKGKTLEMVVGDNHEVVMVKLERDEVTRLRDALSFFLNE